MYQSSSKERSICIRRGTKSKAQLENDTQIKFNVEFALQWNNGEAES
jgi:hypothetical protein